MQAALDLLPCCALLIPACPGALFTQTFLLHPLPAPARGKTRGGYDLNRNFPDHYRDAGKDLSRPGITPDPTQPEVQAMMEFLLSRTFVMGANFHEGSLVRAPRTGPQMGREPVPGMGSGAGQQLERLSLH